MVDDRAVRMAMEFAALVAAVRRYVTQQDHEQGGCVEHPCLLCEALAVVDRTVRHAFGCALPTRGGVCNCGVVT